MRPEARALLWDAQEAAQLITTFIAGRDKPGYLSDVLLRSAVERQFQIVGEALNRLSRVDPATAAAVPDLARIVAFRNVLVHGYTVVEDALVCEAATRRPRSQHSAAGSLGRGDHALMENRVAVGT